MDFCQKTISRPITIEGRAVHSGFPSLITLYPAPPNSGVVFIKRWKNKEYKIKATIENVYKTSFCTGLSFAPEIDFTIDTIEHLMSALNALGIDNILIQIENSEIPILDGSAKGFVEHLFSAGILEYNEKKKFLLITEKIRVENQFGFAEFIPFDGCNFDITIDFPNIACIREQNVVFNLNSSNYIDNIAPARTFGFIKNIEDFWAAGLALNSNFENSIIIGADNKVINPDGLRFKNEFVKHKLLDTIGDCFLLGYRFIGKFKSYCGGHGLTFALLKKLSAKGIILV